jgi:CBS domain-containing protein
MRKPSNVILDGKMSVADAWEAAKGSAEPHFLVRSAHKMWFAVSGEDLHRWSEAHMQESLDEALGDKALPYVHPDQNLEEALFPASKWPIVPVLSREDLALLLGVITQNDILEAFKNSNEKPLE